MSNQIQLLPDAIANQIAAGEVIQRPASVVKELVENAIDAKATEIKLIIKEAGKTHIQIVDNGNGMNDTDARLSIERHATSKIRESKDLFSIRTMGFRGEALASIAAVSQMELKTRTEDIDVGTRLRVKASEMVNQDLCQAPVGTSISVKNLFFNVPARRRFLKSNAVEMRHILDEFKRLALSRPDISFSLYHNDKAIYKLRKTNRKKRIIDIFGDKLQDKLIPISEESPELTISGYVGTPKSAKKSRTNQFFFVNNRFIKSGYLHHALRNAYSDLLPEGYNPTYFIFFEVNPEFIDVNVHPTKEEIKFEDQNMVYQYLRVGVRHALGQHNISPTLDFDKDAGLDDSLAINHPKPGMTRPPSKLPRNSNGEAWKNFYENLKNDEDDEEIPTLESELDKLTSFNEPVFSPIQIHKSYIITQIKSGMIIIDQQKAHERIIYEEFLNSTQANFIEIQRLLFPEQVDLSPDQVEIMKEVKPELKKMGFEINEFGQGTFILHAIPSVILNKAKVTTIIESVLEDVAADRDAETTVTEVIAQTLSARLCISKGKPLNEKEMQAIIERLFACETPYVSPRGKPCFYTMTKEDLEGKFK